MDFGSQNPMRNLWTPNGFERTTITEKKKLKYIGRT